MRKRFATLTALALLGLPAASAQAQARLGVIGGLSRATFTGGGSQGITWRNVGMVGAMAHLPIGDAFAVRPELLYATKGPRARLGRSADAALKLSYLQLPVLLQIVTDPGVPLHPRLYGGMSVGLLLDCRRGEARCDDDPDLVTRDFDSGLLMGGEIEVLGAGLGLRYEAGLGSVTAEGPGLESHNGVLSFTVQYLFGSR